MQSRFHRALLPLLLFVVTPAFALTQHAPASAHAAAPRPITLVSVQLKNYKFEMPTRIPSGWVRFHVGNVGPDSHMFQLFHLNPGVTESQFINTLETNPNPLAILDLAKAAGGADSMAAHRFEDVDEYLTPGNYEAVCFVEGHFFMGMYKAFTVYPYTPTATPRYDAVAWEAERTISLPSAITHGKGLWLKVENRDADETHELQIYKLNPGVSQADLLKILFDPNFQGAPPVTDVGGVAAQAPGTASIVHLELSSPGIYIALCAVPDENGMPHFLMGMYTFFTVK